MTKVSKQKNHSKKDKDFNDTLKRMLNTPPKPHEKKKNSK